MITSIAALILAAVPFQARDDDMAMGRFVDYEPRSLEAACTDVRRPDVRNMTFRVENEDGDVALVLRFRHGKTRHSTGGGDDTLDWSTTVFGDRTASLPDGTTLRFILVDDVHIVSTSKAYLYVLSCRDNVLYQIFHAGGEGFGADLRNASRGEIRLGWAVWRRGDSHAEPSRTRSQTLLWTPSFRRFAIVGSEEHAWRRSASP